MYRYITTLLLMLLINFSFLSSVSYGETQNSFYLPKIEPTNSSGISLYLEGWKYLFETNSRNQFINTLVIEHEKMLEEKNKKEMEKNKPKPKSIILPYKSGYHKLKLHSSDIHVYITNPQTEKVTLSVGQDKKRQSLNHIKMKNETAKINGGFFSFDSNPLHFGAFFTNGNFLYNPSKSHMDFIAYKDGTTEVKNITSLSKEDKEKHKKNTDFIISGSYRLIKEGKIDNDSMKNYKNSKYRHPRTLFCSRLDGSYALVVADGRSKTSEGLTGKQSAEVLKELECHNGINLDGGGSSTMISNGKLKNNPSDGSMRKIGSAIIVHEK